MAFLLFTPSPVNLRSTVAGPPVNGGQRRQSTVVSDEEPEAPAKAPPSPDYVSSLEHPHSLDYVTSPEEPEHTPLSPGYVPEPEGGSRGDPEEDPADYLADRGDNADDESSDDDDDDEEEEEEEASKDDDDEEEEHPDLVDSSVIPVDDPDCLAEDTEAFKTDESAPTPLPSPRRRTDDLPEADMPLRKRVRFTTLVFGFEVGESSAYTASRQSVLDVATVDATPGCPMSKEDGYRIEDDWDDMARRWRGEHRPPWRT
ncbi:hypothetical protein Tco_0608724 [Tanacetum coccineum]